MAEVIRLPTYIREMIRELSEVFRLDIEVKTYGDNKQKVTLGSCRQKMLKQQSYKVSKHLIGQILSSN